MGICGGFPLGAEQKSIGRVRGENALEILQMSCYRESFIVGYVRKEN